MYSLGGDHYIVVGISMFKGAGIIIKGDEWTGQAGTQQLTG